MPVNIINLANENSQLLKITYQTSKANDSGLFSDVLDYVQNNWRITKNVTFEGLKKILLFCQGTDIKHLISLQNLARQFCDPQEDFPQVIQSKIELFTNIGNIKKRMAFEQNFTNGKDFIYGAMNFQGMGALSYGPVCLVLKKELFRNEGNNLVFLGGDALNYYMNGNELD